jgi:hypothetical protein
MPTAISSFFSIIFESDLTPKATSEYTNEEFIISYNKLTKQMNLGIENKVGGNIDSTMNNNAVAFLNGGKQKQKQKLPFKRKTRNDEDKQVTPRGTSAVSKKKRKTKHLFVPTVWYEGKKMIIRGKAELQKSNDEIYQILERKATAQRKKEFKAITDKEVKSGNQATLTNFCSVKISIQQELPTTQPELPSRGSDECHYESTDEMDDLSWVTRERDLPIVPDWPRTMLYNDSLERK